MLATPLDHGYIDDNNVAGRFVSGELTREEFEIFERHYVDCPECMDRVALAQIFRAEAASKQSPPPAKEVAAPSLPVPAGPLPIGLFNFLSTFAPRQQALIFAASTLALLLMPIGAMTWLQLSSDPKPEPEPVIWLTGSGPVEAQVSPSANWVSIASRVPDSRGVYRLAIVDAGNRPIFTGPDQMVSTGTAIALRVPSLPPEVTFALVERKSENGAYTLVSRHPLIVQWR